MTVIIKVGIKNLIDSTMEIISERFSVYAKNEVVKTSLQSYIDIIRIKEKKLQYYNGKEAKGHVIADDQFYQMESTIRAILMKIFEIEILEKKTTIPQEKISAYREAVSILINKIVKCNAYVLTENDKLAKIVGNATLRRSTYKCRNLGELVSKSKFTAVESFDAACSNIELDPNIIKQVLEFCSVDLMIGIMDLQLIQFLADMRYFPNQNSNVFERTKHSYMNLIKHIMICKSASAIEQYQSSRDSKKLHCSLYLKDNIETNPALYLVLTLFAIQSIFNMCGLLFVLGRIYNIVNFFNNIDIKDVSIGVCSINVVLCTLIFASILVGSKLSKKNDAIVTDDMVLSNLDIIEQVDESLNL
ncbi:hypothetical protein [Ehrlichia canis]|uniref:Uncharacterized protein n=1 Tax=Ehrlichia canis (strain Jake) TaxID=269484 RepID=A0ACA6AW15_EHRCJ|nr:hypothetical protein [Ehrlichia canis]AAZ68668.1 hypothetical protein Ecaj_0634 [Ehrlichia canis str. Jake]AUO54601.1 hypothetical protein C1I72_01635 [Ehrlichia canis]UKC53253.1 hypothetical protein s20019040002_000296 [Ehrlichia canis]UKC54190.1 hypothetical protein s20026770001_000296 [Ehrlichia canis]UKC55126.1 hypothetical protein s21009500007_000296 [Ehrlichia canis]